MTDDARTSRGFGSDNQSGAHPRMLQAIADANVGHAPAYGADPWCERAERRLREIFGEATDVYFTLTGTGANVIALGSLCSAWESVVCPETAHINADECGAPERVAGVKLVPVATPDGKLTPDLVRPRLTGFGFEHHSQPRAISISQASEYGTVYTAEEVRALADLAHEHGMVLHMDGARVANAAAFLGVPVREFTADAGVDMLCFGGTKNGMLTGEAVLLFGEARTDVVPYVRKQVTQLASKMRYVGAQFDAMLEGDLWLELASHANEMARLVAEGISHVPGARVTQPVQANEVFAVLPRGLIAPLAEEFHFYTWDEAAGEVRLVTSWDTQLDDVQAFLGRLVQLAG